MLIQLSDQNFLRLVSYFSPTNVDYAKFLTHRHKIVIPERIYNSLKENEHRYATTSDSFNYHYVMDDDWMRDPRNLYNYYDMGEYASSISDILKYIFRSYELENDIRSDFHSTIEGIQQAMPISFCNCILGFLQACESPIERKYLLSLLRHAHVKSYGLTVKNFNLGTFRVAKGNPSLRIEIQKPIHNLRVDFFVTFEASMRLFNFIDKKDIGELEATSSTVVECQGQQYHYQNSGQINNTNSKLIALQGEYSVLPFSGNKINTDSYHCAETTIDFLLNKIKRNYHEYLKNQKNPKSH